MLRELDLGQLMSDSVEVKTEYSEFLYDNHLDDMKVSFPLYITSDRRFDMSASEIAERYMGRVIAALVNDFKITPKDMTAIFKAIYRHEDWWQRNNLDEQLHLADVFMEASDE